MIKVRIFAIIFLFSLVSCSSVSFSDEIYISNAEIVAVKIEPPMIFPGEDVAVSVAADSGNGRKGEFTIRVGNRIFDSDEAVFTVPENIDEFLSESNFAHFEKEGFADVEVQVNLKNNNFSAKKFFRIIKKDREKPFYAQNPSLVLSYKSKNSNIVSAIKNGDKIKYDTTRNSNELIFNFEQNVDEENVKINYAVSWRISGSTYDLPVLLDFDESSGTAVFDFSDRNGRPLHGEFGFYLLALPNENRNGAENAVFGNDFISFYIDTRAE